jgi:hypothetical protein
LSFAHRCAGTIRRYDPLVTLPAPHGATARPTPPTIDHPNHPGRGLLVLAFVAILIAGGLGGAIGWGIVNTSCTEKPTVAQQLIDTVPGTQIHTHSCDAALVGGALVGAGIAAVGAGIVAGLVLRAQSEWRAHPPGAPVIGAGPDPVSRSGSGGSPPRT